MIKAEINEKNKVDVTFNGDKKDILLECVFLQTAISDLLKKYKKGGQVL